MRSVVAGKPRVHELAKELGVESKTVLATLQEMGEYVKSASSTIEPPDARRLRATMEAAGKVTPAASPAAPGVDGPAGARPAPPKAPSRPSDPTKVAAKRAVPAPP